MRKQEESYQNKGNINGNISNLIFSEKLFLKTQNRLLLLLGIFILALSLRIGRAMELERIEKDGTELILIAKNINESGFSGAFAENPRLPPLYILLILCGIKIGFSPEIVGIFISVVAGSLIIFPVYLIGKRLFSDIFPSLLAALFIAIYPNLARLSAEVLRDPLYQLLSISAICMIIEGISKQKKVFFALAGFFTAFAVATRNEGIEILIIFFIFLLIETLILISDKRNFYSSLARNTWIFAIFAITFISFALPFEISLKGTKSSWTIIDRRVYNFIMGFFQN
ncbi:MAG TPA: glycosyltransferase family 39 protein [Victivallales bacterium]|nr:glycosyltransferase family 39 protein [Victivallales bacterium]HPO89632.1 glycosyltransferase family 39 protein [Victivallales bacterium]HRR28917.1 glycosyltransferase family 39 protein [Victivallales bacterium]HRU00216.1 glycosyltransferase family 39 protein [Victivallales bacterium]